MVDTGAMVSVIGSNLTKYLSLVKADGSNLKDSPFRIRGIGDNAHGTAILQTKVQLGVKDDPKR